MVYLPAFHEFGDYTDQVSFQFSSFKLDGEVTWIGKTSPIIVD